MRLSKKQKMKSMKNKGNRCILNKNNKTSYRNRR